jgi:hypothetical protein
MKRVALFALVTAFICSSVTDALARGPAAPSFSAPSFRAPSLRAPSFKAPLPSIGPTKGMLGSTPLSLRNPGPNPTVKKSLYQVPQATNPYGTTPANNPSAGLSAGRASPVAVSYASTAQYRSICRIADSEEGAGGTCRYQTSVSKSRGDKCQCRGQSGIIQ